MKKFLALIILLAVTTFGQTNATSLFTARDVGSGYAVEWNFTTDSIAGLVSPVFKLPLGGGYDFDTENITFFFDFTSTYITNPAVYATIQGIYDVPTNLSSAPTVTADTVSLDSMKTGTGSSTEGDSTGVMTLNGKRAPYYQMLVRSTAGDINVGKIVLFIPKTFAWKP